MDLVSNFAYKTTALVCASMFVKVNLLGHSPSWYIAEDQQLRVWQLFGVAHATIGIAAFVCSNSNSTANTTKTNKQKLSLGLLRFGVFGFTFATFLCILPLRKVPANKEEKIIGSVMAVLSALVAVDCVRFTMASMKSISLQPQQ